MIFTLEQTRLILEGRKTQTRRPANVASASMAMTEALRSTTLRLGGVVPLERRALRTEVTPDDALAGRRITIAVASLEIIALRLERLRDISPRDVRAEGHRTTIEFASHWLGLERPDIAALETLHGLGERPVWVVGFRVIDEPRLLSARTGRGDYTSDPRLAMRGEAEAVPVAVQEAISKAARERDAAVKAGNAYEVISGLRTHAERARSVADKRHATSSTLRQLDRVIDNLEREIAP